MIQADTETGKSVLNKLATQVIEYISLKFHIGVCILTTGVQVVQLRYVI